VVPCAPAAKTPGAVAEIEDFGKAIEETVGRVFRSSTPAVVRVQSDDDLGKVAGTGFFIDASGTIYTLGSVVGAGDNITISHGGKNLPARLLVHDPRSGIAMVKVDEAATPFLKPGDSTAVQPATPLVVVGYPYDHEATPSFGVVGGLDKQSKGKFFSTTHIRANVPVQRGQAGSPVLNLDGEVIGILVSGFEQGSGCYILPMRAAEKVRSDFQRFGSVRHGWGGVTVQALPEPVEGSQVAIDVVEPNGPAAAGFLSGDVLLKVGDIEVRKPEDALDASFFLTAGEPVNVRVVRRGQIMDVPFIPGSHPLNQGPNLQALGPGSLETIVAPKLEQP
jgi:serine protease Do